MIKIQVRIPDNFSAKHRLPIFKIIFVTAFLFRIFSVSAQEKVVTVGIQYKPLFSSQFFNTGPENAATDGIQFTIAPESGYCLGMVIRRGITNTISFESGINYVKRNYAISINDPDSAVNTGGDFGVVGYEIPVQGLVFIQLSDQIFMDVALGVSLDFYPSDIKTSGNYFAHYSARNSWFSAAVLGNLGWEYRTEKSGFFYLGASYHRPFSFTYTSIVQYQNREITPDYPEYPEGTLELQGSYLTLDIRYFFHSDPQKRKKKTKKSDPKTR